MPFDKDSEDELPVELGPVSNGEYEPPVPSAAVRDAQRRARDRCEINARRLGMTRRAFLRTSMATAAVLLALDACSDEQQRTRGRNSGGRYRLPPESTTESTAARDAPYIHGLTMHGARYDKPWFRLRQASHGATLAFTLGKSAGTAWGTDPADAPPSFGPKAAVGCSP